MKTANLRLLLRDCVDAGARFSYFGNGIDYNIPIMLDNLQCTGQESSILDCPHSGINVYGNCWHQYDAGVTCESM